MLKLEWEWALEWGRGKGWFWFSGDHVGEDGVEGARVRGPPRLLLKLGC